MAEVQERLGLPLTKNDIPHGTTWLYEVREEQPTHRGTPTGFWCDEYRVSFDLGGILRTWTHRSFFIKENYSRNPARRDMNAWRYEGETYRVLRFPPGASSMSFEVPHVPFMLLGRRPRLERPEVSALPRFGVLFARIQPIPSR